jgi:hypothetical protein
MMTIAQTAARTKELVRDRLHRRATRVGESSARGVRGVRARLAGNDPRQQADAMADVISRATAALARFVLSLPGGPKTAVGAALSVIALALYAWSVPANSERVQMRPFIVEYAFDYQADLPANLVYEGQQLSFGDPIFLNVIDTVDVTVGWHVPRGDVIVSGGQLAVTTVLRSEAGWTRVLDRIPEVTVDGLKAASSVRINFPEAIALARQIDETTGVARPVTLEVLVETLLNDAVAPTGGEGTPVDGYSTATLAFALDERVVRVVDIPIAPGRTDSDPLAGILTGTGSASSETGDASTQTGRASTETGSASRFSQNTSDMLADEGRVGVREVVQLFPTDVAETNTLRVGPVRMDVAAARRNFTLLGLLLLAGGLLGLSALRRIEAFGEAAVIEARYGPMLTPLPAGVNGYGALAIDVGSFESLHALALDRDTPIMVDRAHGPSEVAHYLFDGPTTYRYVARGYALTRHEGMSPTRRETVTAEPDGPTVSS